MNLETKTPNDPFFRAYDLIRSELARASRATGSQIRIDETAKALGISSTPVREALARLAGERLVRRSRRHGYFVPHLGAADLVELFSLAEIHLLAAIQLGSAAARTTDDDEGKRPQGNSIGLGRLFVLILAASRNSALVDSGALTIERLAAARLVADPTEAALEEGEFAKLLLERRFAELSDAIRCYHESRRSDALAISKAIADLEDPQEKYFPDMI